MNQYEVMYVIDPTLEEQVRQELVTRFSGLVEQNGGTIDRIDEWGKRRLAYPIQYKTEGYYVLMYITAPADLPRELERNLQISDSVLRYLVIRFEGALPPKREPLKPSNPTPVKEAPVVEVEAAPAVEVVETVEAVTEAPVEEVAEVVEAAVVAATPTDEA